MKFFTLIAGSLLLIGSVVSTHATSFSPQFTDYPQINSISDVDTDANTYFYTNYGITIDHAYLYRDERDTFDGLGLSAGFNSQIGQSATGRITFADTTNFVTIEWWVIANNTGIYSAFNSNNELLGSFTRGGSTTDVLGTDTITANNISYLLFSGIGGYTQVSGLTYNYDGITDGHNNDINPVPEPSTMLLLGGGLAGLALWRRKQRK